MPSKTSRSESISDEIVGCHVSIRKPRLSDAPAIQSQVSRPEIVRWTTRIPHPYPEAGAARFLRRSLIQRSKQQAYVFTITERTTGQVAGLVSLGAVSRTHGCAELGFWVGVGFWGKGIATEAVRLALRFAFEDLGLFRVYASAFEANHAGCRVLKKNGFHLEGTLRQAVIREGRRQNYLNFGLLRLEYEKSQTAY